MLRRKVLLSFICALFAAQLASAGESQLAPALELARALAPVMPLASTMLLSKVEQSIPTPIPSFEGGTMEVMVAKRLPNGKTVTACVENEKEMKRVLAARPETIAKSKTAETE
ncbi:MAG TPA: hypothetical protein VGF69_19240 [Thermoanaerobaculia bacterium]|jgi:hypothetical protein